MNLSISTVAPLVAEVVNSSNFHTIDYVVFAVLLAVSMGIGVYFGYFSKSEQTTEEYLLGGRNMKTGPIAISLIASQLSAATIISIPAEAYAYGSHYMLTFGPLLVLTTVIVNYAILPVFYVNNIDNCYAYLELRFSKSVRQLLTSLFFIIILFFMPIASFLPALTFAQISGQNLHVVNVVVSSICVLYTMMGGIKAVVWTDVIQATVMVFSIGVVFVSAVVSVGGFGEIIRRAIDGGRISAPLLNFDLTTRQTLWSNVFGTLCLWVSHIGLTQSCVQRMVALPSLGHARRAMVLFCIGVIVIMVSNSFIGTIIYAYYHDCDPIKAGAVNKIDKLVPYFVNDLVGHIGGMPGLFVSCVFSAALSTLSASLNALAGIIYKDYICQIRGYHHTEYKANVWMKSIVVIVGVYCVLFGFALERATSILQVMYTLAGLTQGAVFGVFLLGMLYPRANSKAAICGVVVSMIFMAWIVIGGQMYREVNHISYETLPTSVAGCEARNINVFIAPDLNPPSSAEDTQSFYNISFTWYTAIGALIVWLVAIPLSHCIGDQDVDRTINASLISPLAQFLLPKDKRHIEMQAVKPREPVNNVIGGCGGKEFQPEEITYKL